MICSAQDLTSLKDSMKNIIEVVCKLPLLTSPSENDPMASKLSVI